MTDEEEAQYLTPSKVAGMLHVSPKTVSRWANQGFLPCLITLGGHRRFRREDVDELLRQMAGEQDARHLPRPTNG